MSLRVHFDASIPQTQSPYRLLKDLNPVDWANRFLDVQKLRGLSQCSLRGYAFDLLNLARWFEAGSIELSQLNHAGLLDYIRFQLSLHSAPKTINHRLCVARCLYRFHYGREVPSTATSPQQPDPFSRRWSRRVHQELRVKVPDRVVVPLSASEVSAFRNSLRTFRDLSLVALMLFCGLRSREALELRLDDLRPGQSEMLVRGKGNRQRLLPIDPQTIQLIGNYLSLERPRSDSPFVFLVLKGPHRAEPLTPAGLRSLFRHHRKVSTILKANPHRFRHTFGTDMVRAGISLPALMRLMGHRHIHTTMLYVQLCPRDVWREFQRCKKIRLDLPENP